MPKQAMESLTEAMYYVLMAVKARAMCGIEMVDFITLRTGGRVKIGPATLYTILAKFEKMKYIKEIAVDGRKRTYEITQVGLDAYANEILRLKKCLVDTEI